MVALITDALDVFTGGTADANELRVAIQTAFDTALDWINAQSVPIPAESRLAFDRVAEVADTVRRTADGWVALGPARRFLDAWQRLLDSDVEAGGALGRGLRLHELDNYATFVERMDGARAGLDLLSEEALGPAEAAGSMAYLRCVLVRADLRRVLGDFSGAYLDLEWCQDALARSAALEAARYALCSAYFRLELDLGRLDRASRRLAFIREFARSREDDELLQVGAMAHELEFLAANDRHATVVQLSKRLIEGHRDFLRSTDMGTQLRARLELLQAVSIAKVSDDPIDLETAAATFEALLRPDSRSSQTARTIASVESAALALKRGDPEQASTIVDRLEADADSTSEDGVASRLFRTRIAARRLEVALALGKNELHERAQAELLEAFDQLLLSWSELDVLPGGVGFLHFEERLHVMSLLVEATLDGSPDAPERALDLVLRADARSTVARQLGAPEANSRALIAHCQETESALVLLVASRDRTHRFAVTAGGVEHERVAGKLELELPLKRINERLRRPTVAPQPVEANARGHETDFEFVASQLVPDSIRAKPDRFHSVQVVGADGFGLVPLETLPCDNGSPLGLAVPFSRAPSASWLLETKARDAANHREREGEFRVGLFALSGVEHGGVRIDLNLAEFESLRAATNGMVDVQQAGAATRESFLNQATAGADLFIAWSHGDSDFTAPIPASIFVAATKSAAPPGSAFRRPGAPEVPPGLELLGGERVAVALRAAGSDAVPGVAFLAACNTALGHRRVGDADAGNLGGVFLGAGTNAVLIADRPIERDAALHFLTEFARAYLRDRSTAAEASLAARRAVAGRPGFERPHYWAPLQLVGWGDARAR